MIETWRIPFELLGLPEGAEPPRRAAVRVAPPDALSTHGGGLVVTPDTFEWIDDDELEPVEGGLYDEDTFGPLPRTPGGGVDLGAYQTQPSSRRPQIRRPGEIVLSAPVLNPWLRRFAIEQVAEAAGVEPEEADGVMAGRLCLDARQGRVVPLKALDDDLDVMFGARALRALASERGRYLEGNLWILPVLPAGLRPARVVGGQVQVSDPTWLYQVVLEANEKVARCRSQEVAPRFLAGAVADLQRAVEALCLDGLDADGLPPEPGERPQVVSFGEKLGGAFGEACLGDLAEVTDFDSFVLTLRGSLYHWRAIVEASCLEVVLLREDGSIDEESRSKILTDNAAGCFDDVYHQILGEPWQEQLVHGPLSREVPHVDVYSFAPRSPGEPARLITAGMSTRFMAEGPGVDLAELTALVRPDLDSASAEAIMQAVLALALFPFRHGTSLGPGHDVRIGAPLLPGSALSAWVLYAVDEDEVWVQRIGNTLPRHPELLLAVAVTEEELQLKLTQGSAALRGQLEAVGAMVIDPDRSSVVP